MEVSQARLDLVQARDVLTKARVTVHSFNVARIEADIKPGLETAAKDYDAGKKAMAERNYRRVGLGISLVAIALCCLDSGCISSRLSARTAASSGHSVRASILRDGKACAVDGMFSRVREPARRMYYGAVSEMDKSG